MTGKNLPIRFTITWDWNPGLQDERRSFGGPPNLCSFFKKRANPGLFLFIFVIFTWHIITNTIKDKNIHGVLGTKTQGGRMVCADKSTELLRPSKSEFSGNEFKLRLQTFFWETIFQLSFSFSLSLSPLSSVNLNVTNTEFSWRESICWVSARPEDEFFRVFYF